ncbi:MAG: hypothetical protein WCO56_17920 [Verrucomicrobiota bacterium]
MKWKAWALIVLVGAAILVALLVPGERGTSGEREPSYQGHRYSWWVDQYVCSHPDKRDPKVVEAMFKIGTNATPCLFKWMRVGFDIKPSRTKKAVKSTLQHLPLDWRPGSLVDWTEEGYEMMRAKMACQGFSVLGTNARPAIPELERLVLLC